MEQSKGEIEVDIARINQRPIELQWSSGHRAFGTVERKNVPHLSLGNVAYESLGGPSAMCTTSNEL